MKAIYGKYVRDLLDRAMAEHLPEYEPFTLKLSKEQRKAATLFSGSRIYRRVVNAQLHLFIHMIPDQRQERFLLEVGWSTRARFPHELSSTGSFLKPDGGEFAKEECLADFNELHHRKYGKGFLGWNVWECSMPMPELDLSRARDPKYKEDYESRSRAWREIFVKEDLRPVSEAEARERAERAVLQCISDIKAVAEPYLDEAMRLTQRSVI